MKRAIQLFLVLWVISVNQIMYGNVKKTITLNNKEHTTEIVSLSYCNIFVELQIEDMDEQYGINIKMENISENKILYLFDRSYREKDLKKMGLIYDKRYPGPKGKRDIEACKHTSESYQLLPSSETKSIISFQSDESLIKLRLPIYIARYDEKNLIIIKKSRIALEQKDVIELDIDVEIKPDDDFIRLSAAADSLIEEIGKQTFCSNKNHKGASLKTLYAFYNKSIEDLKMQVTSLIRSRGYMSTSKGFKLFMTIVDRLNAIDLEKLTVSSCDNDKKTKQKSSHSCKYCSLSAEDIYKRLESYYIDLHNGKKSKEQVMADVEALYNCAQKNTKRSAGNFMSRISMYYNRIKSK